MSSEVEVKYTRRNEIEEARPLEVQMAFRAMQDAIARNVTLPRELRGMIFTMSSIGAGCRHCQSHGAYGLSRGGVSVEKIQALWDFEASQIFDDAERAALRFARDASLVPNAVTPKHHEDLRRHFTDRQIAEILTQICVAGWLNRWSDSLAVVTDQESVDWALENLTPVGWELGKHAGDSSEQRKGGPEMLRRLEEEAWARQQANAQGQ
jgi:alkylhydroperoxidase family enzyme